MRPILFICMMPMVTLWSCHAQTVDKQIEDTSKDIITAIANNDEKKFKEMIGVELLQIGKNEELLHFDFEKISSLYSQYIKSRKPEIIITDQYNKLGNLKVIIPFYKGFDSTNNIRLVQLELYFGPPNFVPLNKIANYKIVIDRDVKPSISPPKIQKLITIKSTKKTGNGKVMTAVWRPFC